ncbi:PaaI family thioesterase [Rhodoligotrophos ferricapiens]|uniref:PaaI family thioesterase n=1 Tax=Rhodoligotrophos ferricapiens TaxID=3069264 RepID=UPI00315CE093
MNLFQELDRELSGLEQMQALIRAGGRAPIGETLEFQLVEVGDGLAVFEGTPGPHAYNPVGSVHGGYAATLLDSACGCAVHTKLSAEQAYTTLELKVAYHKALTAKTGTVRAEGRVLTIGRRVAFSEAKLVDSAGALYASATSTLLVFAR